MPAGLVMLSVFYGGTFDPVHNGHLAVARAACDALGADIQFIPAADPPHRAPPGASAEQRTHMLSLAIANEPRFHVDTRELRRNGPSYTVDTLHEIRKELDNNTPVVWLLGADAFRELNTWHHWHELFNLAHFVIAQRPGFALKGLNEELVSACRGRWCQTPDALLRAPAGHLWLLELPPRTESASEIRHHLNLARENLADGLPASVTEFIQEQGLYRSGYN